MEKPDTPQVLRQLAGTMRRQALETAQPAYQGMMNRVADSLEAEAEIVAERQAMDFANALDIFCGLQFTSAPFH